MANPFYKWGLSSYPFRSETDYLMIQGTRIRYFAAACRPRARSHNQCACSSYLRIYKLCVQWFCCASSSTQTGAHLLKPIFPLARSWSFRTQVCRCRLRDKRQLECVTDRRAFGHIYSRIGNPTVASPYQYHYTLIFMDSFMDCGF